MHEAEAKSKEDEWMQKQEDEWMKKQEEHKEDVKRLEVLLKRKICLDLM